MQNLERQYLENAAKDPNHELNEEDLQLMRDGVDWFCYLQCYVSYLEARKKGASKEDCKLRLANCIVDCSESFKPR